MLILILGALLVGLTLGLLGSGGSAITVPFLVYVAGHGAKVAIAESMAIVGLIALAAAVPHARKRLVDWGSVVWFGIAGMVGTYIGAWLGGLVSGSVQLLVFGLVLLLTAGMMIRKAFGSEKKGVERTPSAGVLARAKMMLEGLVVGVLTGFVGVGGGFLIVPALVLLAGLPIRVAIGTSLVIIAAKSLVGFLTYLDVLRDVGATVDWRTVAVFSAAGVVASAFGSKVAGRLGQRRLKQVFAVFLVGLGMFVIVKEGLAT